MMNESDASKSISRLRSIPEPKQKPVDACEKGQIWRLRKPVRPTGGWPPPYVLVLERLGGDVSVAAISFDVECAASDDFLIATDENPFAADIAILLWTKWSVSRHELDSCYGELVPAVLGQILTVEESRRVGRLSGGVPPYRIGPEILSSKDPRIRWREEEMTRLIPYRPSDEKRVLQLAASTDTAESLAVSEAELDEFQRMAGVVGILTLDKNGEVYVQRLIYQKGSQPSTKWARDTQQGLNAALTAANAILKKIKGAGICDHTDFYPIPWDKKEDLPADIEGRSISLSAGLCMLSSSMETPLPGVIAVGDIDATGKVKKVKADALVTKIRGLAESPTVAQARFLILPKANEENVSSALSGFPSLASKACFVSNLLDAFNTVSRVPKSIEAVPVGDITLKGRNAEHYKVAVELDRRAKGTPFTRADFISLYKQLFPDRAPGSILPADYVKKFTERGDPTRPRFLVSDEEGAYRLSLPIERMAHAEK